MDKESPLEIELHGYVDGTLDDAAMARVEDYLQRHSETASKVHDYLRHKTDIREFADRAVTERAPASFLALERQLSRRLKRRTIFPWHYVAATVVLFSAGWVGHMLYVSIASGPSYADEVVQAHMLSSADPEEVPRISPERVAKLFARLGEIERIPDLRAFGYEPIGAQLLPSDEGAMLHVPYRSANGTVVSYFLLHDEEEDNVPRHILHRHGLTLAYWQIDHSRYAVAGPLSDDQLDNIADFLQAAREVF